jgi:hypothetical protein
MLSYTAKQTTPNTHSAKIYKHNLMKQTASHKQNFKLLCLVCLVLVPATNWKLERTSLTPCKLHNLNLTMKRSVTTT